MKDNFTTQKFKTPQSYSKLFAIFVIIFTFLSGISFSQSKSITDFYYYNNAPYYLDLNKDNVYLRLKNVMTKEEFINSSQSFRQLFSYDNFIFNDKDQIIKLNHKLGESGISDLINNLKSTGLYEYVSPVFSTPVGKGDRNTLIIPKDEIIVQYKSTYSDARIAEFEQSKNLTFVQDLDLRGGITKIYRVDQNTFSMDAANDIFESGMVNYSEPNFYMTNLLKYVPNDPLFSQQWALRNTGNNIPGGITGIPGCDMRLDSAWNITLGSNKVKIAIIDSGVDTLHEDLAANILPNSQFNFITNSTNAFDDNGHGTGCSGIAAAIGNNSTGISGVAPNSKIINIKSLDQNTSGTYEDLIEGLIYAWQSGAWVSSNSWGSYTPSSGIDNAILDGVTFGRNGKGTIYLFATGNDNTFLSSQSINPNVIAVGGVSPCNQRKSPLSCDGENFWGANYGTGLSVVAPCVKVYTTDITGSGGWSNTNYLDNFNGTSGAAPNVAGICALMLSVDSTLSWMKVREFLCRSADKVGSYSYNFTGPYTNLGQTWNNEMGYGKVNANTSLKYTIASIGFTFNHTPLANTEILTGPYTVSSSIVSLNGAINPAGTKLFWTRGNSFDSIPMTNSGGSNWTANIPGNGSSALYKYFIKATDVTGASKTYPVFAPDTYFSFNAVYDVTPPLISHSAIPVVPVELWPAKIISVVTDSVGIDSVWVKWYKNNPAVTKEFKLINVSDNNYEAIFNSINSDVVYGDSIFYRIFAQDNSGLHNRDSTSLYFIKIRHFDLNQNFASEEFPPLLWNLQYTGVRYWLREDYSGYGIGTGTSRFNFWNAQVGVTQSMITHPFEASSIGDTLKFDHAYATWSDQDDSLIIQVSTNSGLSYSLLIGLVGGVSGPLVTAPPTTEFFIPTASQWATKKYALPVGVNKIRFKAVSAYGNNFYMDNVIKVSGLTGISINLNEGIPNTYSLNQNYPNPFNPSTKINYNIPVTNFVTLKIYDVLGKEVASLVNEKQSAGSYTVDFFAGNLSSGVYFYRIKSGEFIQTKSMMLLK